jgi:hypothetical protein
MRVSELANFIDLFYHDDKMKEYTGPDPFKLLMEEQAAYIGAKLLAYATVSKRCKTSRVKLESLQKIEELQTSVESAKRFQAWLDQSPYKNAVNIGRYQTILEDEERLSKGSQGKQQVQTQEAIYNSDLNQLDNARAALAKAVEDRDKNAQIGVKKCRSNTR